MSRSTCRVAIIGAGPYSLAAAAHLCAANVPIRVFGQPMEFWQHQMPRGMFLRSSWDASHISDPGSALTLDAYQAAHNEHLSRPVPLASFIAYGQWFQRRVVPDLDRRKVTRIDPASDGFCLCLEDGDSVQAKRVVVAAGLAPFAHWPVRFAALPAELVSHASDHSDLGCFTGQDVIVVGGGQSAFESAALLHENGARVELVMRAPGVRWLRRSAWLHSQPGLIGRLLYPSTDVGPPVLNWIVALPDVFRLFPRAWQKRIAYRSIRPAAAAWLVPRTEEVRITTGRRVVSAVPDRERLKVTLDDGTKRCVDHILLATGYRVDVSRYPFLAPELVRGMRCINGYPYLAAGFESSVPGLHFIGAPAAWSFGPLMRFVAGTSYAAQTLARSIVGAPSSA